LLPPPQVKNMMNNHPPEYQANNIQKMRSKSKLVLVGFLIIAGYFLFTEHRAHLGGVLYYLPVLFLLACPLMHIFMHNGHNHGNKSNKSKKGDA
jgi:hypothetical protein